jgi:ribosomal protein S18 acetylase RimI-like enzyme
VTVKSIGWRTDVALRKLEGAEILEHDGHLVIRTPNNPGYRWGNFLLFDAAPRSGDEERWLELFKAAFPTADHVAIGFECPAGETVEAAGFSARQLSMQADTILTADSLRRPGREPPQATFRALHSEEDWRRAVELRLAVDESAEAGYRDFLTRQMQAIRHVCERGHGAWFGAFSDDQMRSSLGIFDAGSHLARFQSVDTHPEHRGQGLASNLLCAAGEYAASQLGARTLVIAADPSYLAIDIYRSLGFCDRERLGRLELLGDPGSSSSFSA